MFVFHFFTHHIVFAVSLDSSVWPLYMLVFYYYLLVTLWGIQMLVYADFADELSGCRFHIVAEPFDYEMLWNVFQQNETMLI